MQTIELDSNTKYTFADYLTWIDEKRRELIHGFVQLMTPAPLRIHQEVSANFEGVIWNYLRQKKCKVYASPFDVRLPKGLEKENDKIFTVVQPDLCIVCDLSKLDEYGCVGAPDFIIEIVSKKNSKHDVETKFKLYEEYGVLEYWIVYPYEQTVHVFLLDKKKYVLKGIYAQDSKIKVNIFDDFYIDLDDIFEKND